MATGKDLLKRALEHLGERYLLGVVVPKDDPAWAGPWDCAEFATWLAFQEAGILYGVVDRHVPPAIADAYTGAWGRDARQRGRKVSVERAAGLPGAMLLRLGPKSGHIAVSDGRGGTVEAHSSRTGVIRHRVDGRRWDLGVLLPGVEYDGGSIPVARPQVVYRLMSPCMRDTAIREIQRALLARGYDPGQPDGVFGPLTEATVRRFQVDHGLVPDGEVGAQTALALETVLF